MPLNYSTLVYLPVYTQFARPVEFSPIVSQPTSAVYNNRGIFDTDELDIVAMDGSIVSDQRTVLYIREAEFSVLPQQGDLVSIPEVEGIEAEGIFEITDSDTNGGGETKLSLRKWVDPMPAPIGDYLSVEPAIIELEASATQSVGSLSLPPGDWDVSAVLYFQPPATNVTMSLGLLLSTVSGVWTPTPGYGSIDTDFKVESGNYRTFATLPARFNNSTVSAITVYCNLQYSTDNPIDVKLFMNARRWK